MNICRNVCAAMLSASLIVLSGGCSKSDERHQPLRNVILTSAQPLAGNVSTDYPGVVEENSNVSAGFMAEGKIAKINVKEGDRVRKGQLLAILDDSDYRIGVGQLEAQYAQMTKEKARMDTMFARHNIAPNDYEKFVAGYEQLKLQLDMVNRKLDYTRLYSPSDGYIATKYLNEGELAGAGTPVVAIVDDSRLVAAVDLPVDVYLGRDNIESATGRVPQIENPFTLKQISFTPDADNSMLYHLKLEIPSTVASTLSPGMNITVNLRRGQGGTDGFIVPSRAIFRSGDTDYVWAFNDADSTIHQKAVVIAGNSGEGKTIVKGLAGDEKIVETGVKQLYDGEKVNILNKKDLGLD